MTGSIELNLSAINGFAQNDVENGDPALHLLLEYIVYPSPDNSVTMTISSNGQLVAGHVISMKRWTEEMSEALHERLPYNQWAEIGSPLIDAIDDLDWEHDNLVEERETAGLPAPRQSYIHMQDVTIGRGADGEKEARPFWRGRINSIDGWTLGI